jgi:hypothetical protein
MFCRMCGFSNKNAMSAHLADTLEPSLCPTAKKSLTSAISFILRQFVHLRSHFERDRVLSCEAELFFEVLDPGYLHHFSECADALEGGPDAPSNMQWQTVEAAKEKDKWERKGCQ